MENNTVTRTFELVNDYKVICHGSLRRCIVDKALLDYPEQAEMFSPETLKKLHTEYKGINRKKAIKIRQYEPYKRKK